MPSQLLTSARRQDISVSEHLFNLQSNYLQEVKSLDIKTRSYSNWALSHRASCLLEERGITINDRPLQTHSHPACKTIEEYILHVCVPVLLSESTTVLWTKDNKAQTLANCSRQNITAINVAISPKDYLRYSHYDNSVPNIEDPIVFMHDSAHYLTPYDIYALFQRSPNLKFAIATVIMPPELLDDQPPLFPEIYSFKKFGDQFQFYPDGHVAGEYTQPISGLWWLKTNRIIGPNYTIKLMKIESYFAHHIFIMTALPADPPKLMSFDFPGRLQLKQELVPYFKNRFRSIDGKIFKAVMGYAMSVNSAKEFQIAARARASMHTSTNAHLLADMVVAMEFGLAIHNTHMKFVPDNLETFQMHHLITRKGPIRWLRILLNAGYRKAYENILEALDPPPYTATQNLEAHILNKHDKLTTAFTSKLPQMSFWDVLKVLEAILKGSLSEEDGLNGNNLPDFPYFSTMFVNYTLDYWLPYLHIYVKFNSILKLIRKIISYILNNKRKFGFVLPIFYVLGILLKNVLPQLYRNLKVKLVNQIRKFHIENLLPLSITRVYTNMKMLSLSSTTDHKQEAFKTFYPVVNSNIEIYKPEQDLVNALTQILPNAIPVQNIIPPQNDEDLNQTHLNCKCRYHVISEEMDKDNKWNTCQGGHGYYGSLGGKCHICKSIQYPEQEDEQPLLHGQRIQKIKIAHPEVTTGYNCAINGSSHEGDIDCPQCLMDNFPNYQPPIRPKTNMCLFDAVHDVTMISLDTLWHRYAYENPRAEAQSNDTCGWNQLDAEFLALRNGICLRITTDQNQVVQVGLPTSELYEISYSSTPGHYMKPIIELNGLGSDDNKGYINDFLNAAEGERWRTYKPSKARADNFLKNIKNNKYGFVLPHEKEFIKKAESIIMAWDNKRSVKLAVIYGGPGTGKTYPVVQVLSKVPPQADIYRMIFPTVELRSKTVPELKLPGGYGFKAPTPETPFLGSYTSIMIGDEIGKFPPGYFDLLIPMCPTMQYLMLSGDPAQTIYNCDKPDNTLNSYQAEIDRFAKYALCYKTLITRLCCGVAHKLGVEHKCNERKGEILKSKKAVTTKIILSADKLEAITNSEFGLQATTFSGSQGSNYDEHYSIQINKASAKADDRAWYTALTRGKRGIVLLLPSNKIEYHRSAIARALIASDDDALKLAVNAHIAKYTPAHLRDPLKKQIDLNGMGLQTQRGVQTELVNTNTLPHLSGILTEYEYIDYDFQESVKDNNEYPTVELPQIEFRGLNDIHQNNEDQSANLIGTVNLEPSFDDREILIYDQVTQQVDDRSLGHAMFLRHKRGDLATEQWTNEGRWVPYKPGQEDLSCTEATGHALFLAFKTTYEIPESSFDECDWEKASKIDEQKFISKGFKVLDRIKERADPQWINEYAETFMKGQSITKPGTYNRVAKMGQLVISFNTYVNFKFGPLARYLRLKLDQTLPETFFWMDGKHDGDLSEFVIKYWDFEKDSCEDDYTCFDSTQGGEFLNFDALLMRHYNIPEHIIQHYLNFMVSIYTWMGQAGIMMFSGIKFTLMFNSTRSAAYQALKYRLPKQIVICITGDDVACNGVFQERQIWQRYYNTQFKLISKRAQKKYVTFCGWIIVPLGCIKDPLLLQDRTIFQLARNNLSLCYYNYAADLTPLHKNFELHMPCLSEEQMEAHFTTLSILRSQAKLYGVNLKQDFETNYGQKRTYDLNGCGIQYNCNHNNIQNIYKNINKSENKLNKRNMPYTTKQESYFQRLENAEFARVRQTRTLIREMNEVDFSVVESRREGHQALNRFEQNMLFGTDFFGMEVRFPKTPQDLYITKDDTEIANILTSLSNVLSWRKTNVAKDTQSDKNSKNNVNEEKPNYDQETQDNSKRFEELVKRLNGFVRNAAYLWNQSSFESRTFSEWEDPDESEPDNGDNGSNTSHVTV